MGERYKAIVPRMEGDVNGARVFCPYFCIPVFAFQRECNHDDCQYFYIIEHFDQPTPTEWDGCTILTTYGVGAFQSTHPARGGTSALL